MTTQEFQTRVLNWYDEHGRKQLPWQQQRSPYHVWLSEIMLQQTQVTTVIPYFLKFTQRFNQIENLANADLDDVLHLWAGLGYYARARNLYQCAKIISHDYQGVFPNKVEDLEKLPGIGRSTAGAIKSLAFEQPAAILDGNVKRVFCRFFGIEEWAGKPSAQKKLWLLAEDYKSLDRPRDYSQVLMDLGALLCTRSKPSCQQCPLQSDCYAMNNELTDQLPIKKPSKKIPSKDVQMLILLNDKNEILLQKRPTVGIWGGLWSLPESAEASDQQLIKKARQLGCKKITKVKSLQTFRHTFSHFHLMIHPSIWRVSEKSKHVAELDTISWEDINDKKLQ